MRIAIISDVHANFEALLAVEDLLREADAVVALGDYLYLDSPKLQELKNLDYDLIAFGQTHRSYVDIGSRPGLLNPGSVGQARHARAPRASPLWIPTPWRHHLSTPPTILHLSSHRRARPEPGSGSGSIWWSDGTCNRRRIEG